MPAHCNNPARPAPHLCIAVVTRARRARPRRCRATLARTRASRFSLPAGFGIGRDQLAGDAERRPTSSPGSLPVGDRPLALTEPETERRAASPPAVRGRRCLVIAAKRPTLQRHHRRLIPVRADQRDARAGLGLLSRLPRRAVVAERIEVLRRTPGTDSTRQYPHPASDPGRARDGFRSPCGR